MYTLLFHVVVLQEENLLANRYGADYDSYRVRVPRFLPDPKLWGDSSLLTVTPDRVLRTFGDAMLLLLSIPLAEGFETLQDLGVLPVFFHLA